MAKQEQIRAGMVIDVVIAVYGPTRHIGLDEAGTLGRGEVANCL